MGRLPRLVASAFTLVLAAGAICLASGAQQPAAAADEGIRFDANHVDAWEGQGRISIRIERRGTVALGESKVSFRTADIEAKAGTDYLAAEGTAVLGVGQTSSVVETFSLDDTDVEELERFEVMLVDPDDRSRVLDRTVVLVTDDDEPVDDLSAAASTFGGGSAPRQRVTAPATPPPAVVVRRPAAASSARRSSRAASTPRATPFRLYAPAPSEPASVEPGALSPARAMSIVAAVLLASVAARVWTRWRIFGV